MSSRWRPAPTVDSRDASEPAGPSQTRTTGIVCVCERERECVCASGAVHPSVRFVSARVLRVLRRFAWGGRAVVGTHYEVHILTQWGRGAAGRGARGAAGAPGGLRFVECTPANAPRRQRGSICSYIRGRVVRVAYLVCYRGPGERAHWHARCGGHENTRHTDIKTARAWDESRLIGILYTYDMGSLATDRTRSQFRLSQGSTNSVAHKWHTHAPHATAAQTALSPARP